MYLLPLIMSYQYHTRYYTNKHYQNEKRGEIQSLVIKLSGNLAKKVWGWGGGEGWGNPTIKSALNFGENCYINCHFSKEGGGGLLYSHFSRRKDVQGEKTFCNTGTLSVDPVAFVSSSDFNRFFDKILVIVLDTHQ